MVKNRQKRDRKRKRKRLDRGRRSHQAGSLAYMGKKYQTEELIPIWLETEIGIYETFVMTDRSLVDRTVTAALEKLIRQIRTGTLPLPPESGKADYAKGTEGDLLIGNIRRRWEYYFQDKEPLSRDKLVGVLRTILGSVEKVRSSGPPSQSYLYHIADFLTNQLGVSVEEFSLDEMPLPIAADDRVAGLHGRIP